MTEFRMILLICLVICTVAVAIIRKPLTAVVIYTAYSLIVSVIWLVLESPDLAITEAAVGGGITSILLFLTLRRIDLIDQDESQKKKEEVPEHEAS